MSARMSPSTGRSGAIALAATFGLTSLVSVALVNVLASRATDAWGLRFDVTASGEHRLSPRTRQVLRAMPEGTRVIVALDPADGPANARDVMDVLREMTRSGPNVQLRPVEPGQWAQGAGQALAELAQRSAPATREQTARVEAAARASELFASQAEQSLSPALLELRPQAEARQRAVLDQRAAALRILARDARATVAASRERLAAQALGVDVPDAPEAARLLTAAMRPVLELLDAARAETAAIPGESARALTEQLQRSRDALAVALEPIRAMEPTVARRVADELASGPAVIIVTPDDASVVPARLMRSGDQRADTRRRIEELLAGALERAGGGERLWAVVVHADAPGAWTGPRMPAALRRVLAQGGRVSEWSAGSGANEPPELARPAPSNVRRVFVLASPDTTQNVGGANSGTDRASALAGALSSLLARGEPVLVTLGPSVFPGFGSPDPLAAALEGWGVRADTGRPVVGIRQTSAGNEVFAELRAQSDAGSDQQERALPRALTGLSASVPWAVPLDVAQTEGVKVQPLLRSVAQADVLAWGESQWVLVWRGQSDARLRVEPRLDEGRDTPVSEALLGLALERAPRGEQARGQRLVVMGGSGMLGNGWFSDGVASRELRVDGRTINPSPGNAALFEGGLLWLAGLEDRIAPGAEVRRGAMVLGERELGGALVAARIGLLAGLPALTLVAGWVVLRRRERDRG
ncbi:MAG: hypothetical protein SFY95_08675 [Planctomycetota bacterium]|nr:hypothetical protein [Planctomycetota bacterium]